MLEAAEVASTEAAESVDTAVSTVVSTESAVVAASGVFEQADRLRAAPATAAAKMILRMM